MLAGWSERVAPGMPSPPSRRDADDPWHPNIPSNKEGWEEFHGILSDISWGVPSERVRKFLIDAYVRGAPRGNAEKAELEGSTAVFTKRPQRTGRPVRGQRAGRSREREREKEREAVGKKQ